MVNRSDIGPYAICPEWVIASRLSDGAVRLYIELALRADRKTGASHPSRRWLAKRMGCTDRTIDKRIAELQAIGAVAVTPRWTDAGDPTSNLYSLRFVPPSTFATPRSQLQEGGEAEFATGGEAGFAQNQSHIEPESNEPDEPSLATAPRSRPRDALFDAVAEVCGWDLDTLTKSAGRTLGVAVAELRAAGATPEQIAERGAVYLDAFDAALTPSALAKWWPSLTNGGPAHGNGQRPKTRVDRARASTQRLLAEAADLQAAEKKGEKRRALK